jgi:hypothetical protein
MRSSGDALQNSIPEFAVCSTNLTSPACFTNPAPPDTHKPDTSSSSPTARLKHTSNESYELGIRDGSDSYTYEGIRKSGDGQYALIFDPVHKHFVLHQIDSNFDVNLTSTPWDQDPASVQDSYEQLPGATKARRKTAVRGATKAAAAKASEGKNRGKAEVSAGPSVTNEKKTKPEKKKKAVREPTPDAEDEDSDDGLTIEYPGGAPPMNRFQSRAMPPASSAPAYRREPSVDSDVDAEFEDDDDMEMGGMERNGDVEAFNLSSPARGGRNNDEEDADGDEEEDSELDLEAALEMALEEADGKADESSESEEE